MQASCREITHTYLLQECMQNGTLLFHVLLLQVLSEMLKGDPGAVGPQVRVKTLLHYLHTLVHQVEQLVMFWGKQVKFGIGGQGLL